MCSVEKKLLVTDLAPTLKQLPSNYVLPIFDRPNLSPFHLSIPLIDLQELNGPNRSHIINQIAHACSTYGFFQVKNHGVSETTISNMLNVSNDFFGLPETERLKNYSDDTTKTTRLSTSFNVKTEKVSNWRDYLRLHCYPLEDFINDWPSNPPSFRKEVGEYSRSVRELVMKLIEAISESLGLERDYLDKALSKHGQHMALNYYPPCPQPELTYGLPPHTDPNLITLLLQDDVPGLQVLHNDQWISVNPLPNTFIVNIGDQMQVISNDKYKSVLHRAIVNGKKARISIPTFYCPSSDAIIGPAKELIDDEHPPVYTSFSYAQYYHHFWNTGLKTQSCLDIFKTSSTQLVQD